MEKLLLPVKIRTLLLCAAAASTLFTGILHASTIGGEGGAYLRYPAGPSALAMGGAYSASPEELLSWWNPALLCLRERRSVVVGGGMRPFGQTDGFAALEFKVPPRMGVGFLLLYRGDPFLDKLYDENENLYPAAAYTTITGKIALSYYINRKLTGGCNIAIRYIRQPAGFSDAAIVSTSATSMGSFDFSLAYQYSKELKLTAQLRNIGATMDWNFTSLYDYSVPSEDIIPPSLLIGSSWCTALYNRPLIWNTDVQMYTFDGSFKKSIRPQALLSSGVEWRYWEKLYLRFGIGDITFNGDMASDAAYYWRTFSMRIAGGMSYDMSKIHQGMRCNYAIGTDKVWAGVDQQIAVTLQF